MKKFKKLFLVVGIVAVLMVMMVVSVSATDVVFDQRFSSDVEDGKTIVFKDFVMLKEGEYIFEEDDIWGFGRYASDSSSGTGIYIYNVEQFNDFITKAFEYDQNGAETYEQALENLFTGSSNIANINSFYSELEYCIDLFDEETLQYFLNYESNSQLKDNISNLNKELEEKNTTVSTLEGQVTELNTTITEKDAVITEKDSTILALENENAVLESSVEGLNTQVNGLVKEKSELNATVKSLEKQLQIKIDKAYAEGLTDADGNVNVLSIIALVFTAVEVIALVVFIITRVRKNKFKKNKGGR